MASQVKDSVRGTTSVNYEKKGETRLLRCSHTESQEGGGGGGEGRGEGRKGFRQRRHSLFLLWPLFLLSPFALPPQYLHLIEETIVLRNDPKSKEHRTQTATRSAHA